MRYLHIMQSIICTCCENLRREGCTYIRAKGITFGLLYTLKIKNAFVLLCALSRSASTPFLVLFLRLFVQSVLLTSR